jgi:putative sterol carrier protein
MPVFSKKVASELFGELWKKMIKETDFGANLKAFNIRILFVMNDPEVTMFIDENGPVFEDEARAKEPTVTIQMDGDTVHQFWLKQIFIPKALAMRQIKAKGPAGKILKLMPLLKSGQAMYLDYCKQFGLPTETKCLEMGCQPASEAIGFLDGNGRDKTENLFQVTPSTSLIDENNDKTIAAPEKHKQMESYPRKRLNI